MFGTLYLFSFSLWHGYTVHLYELLNNFLFAFAFSSDNELGTKGGVIGETNFVKRRDCNQLGLRIAHIVELDMVLFPLLSVVMLLIIGLKKPIEESKKDPVSEI